VKSSVAKLALISDDVRRRKCAQRMIVVHGSQWTDVRNDPVRVAALPMKGSRKGV